MKKLFIACLLVFTAYLSVFAEVYIEEPGAKFKEVCEKEMPPEYFKDPVGYLEELCANKNEKDIWYWHYYGEKAISLSLYYLGFPKEILLSISVPFSASRKYYQCPVPNFSPLLIRGKIRDIKKARHWLNAAYSYSYCPADVMDYYVYFLFEFDFEGINGKTKQKEVIDLFIRWEKQATEECKQRPDNIAGVLKGSRYCHFYGYMFYKGIGVKKDLEKAKFYARHTYISWWKNFYTGFAAPLDQEYARFLLKAIDTEESKKILADIERGVYDKKAEQ